MHCIYCGPHLSGDTDPWYLTVSFWDMVVFPYKVGICGRLYICI